MRRAWEGALVISNFCRAPMYPAAISDTGIPGKGLQGYRTYKVPSNRIGKREMSAHFSSNAD
jgi:hypothetical protein